MTNPIRVMWSFIHGGIVACRMKEEENGLLRSTTPPQDVTEDAVRAVAEYLYREADLGQGDGSRTLRARDGAPIVLSVRGAGE